MKPKKILAVLTALLAVLTASGADLCFGTDAVPRVSAAEVTKLGDCNEDGNINVTDLVKLGRFLCREDDSISPNADVNEDGKINAFDHTTLCRTLLRQYQPTDLSGLVINEVCAQNSAVLADRDGEYSDWIELYNGSDTAVSLNGYGLSDDPASPFCWTFPDVSIPAKGYLLVFASDKDVRQGNELHTNFKLSKDGETLTLTHPTLGTVDTVAMPALEEDVAYGRYKNGSKTLSKLTPTPKSTNDTATMLEKIDAPTISQESGFYNANFNVTMEAPSGCKIYYTTDGSDPTTASQLYAGSLAVQDRSNEDNVYAEIPDTSVSEEYIPKVKIKKSTILRAIAVNENGISSEVVTKTYFVGFTPTSQYNGCPVISLVTDPDNLFDPTKGIYVKGDVYTEYKKGSGGQPGGGWGFPVGVGDDGSTPANYNQRGSEWERPAHIDFFEGDGSLGFSQEIGIRTMGGWSRANLQKNLRCYARGEYGESKFKYELIPGATMELDKTTPLTSYDTFLLRAGGNDCERIKLRDRYFQELVRDRNLAIQDGRPCVVFLDGEYWGVYNIREDYTDDFMKQNYDIPKKEVVMIKVGELEEGEEADMALFNDLISFASNTDLSTAANYAKMCEMIDIDNFIDYFCTEIYIANQDWPNNNYRLWRTRDVLDQPYGDGKWRWLLYDTEFAMSLYEDGAQYNTDSLSSVMFGSMFGFGGQSGTGHIILFQKLMENADFEARFVRTMLDLRNVNFAPEGAGALLDQFASEYRPLISDNFSRFGPQWILDEGDPLQFFSKEVEGIKTFLKGRYEYAPKMLQQNLSNYRSSKLVNVTVQVSSPTAGTVQVNTTTPDFTNGKWTGQYFSGMSITLTAKPAAGHRFVRWSDGTTTAEKTVSLTEALTLSAEFN